MADASKGPVATLPGSSQPSPEGLSCDNHADRVATTRIQGETDSFGCEYFDLCEPCAATLLEGIRKARQQPHRCDWCGQEKIGCRPHRDFEEGTGGAVYTVCPDCIRMESARIATDYI